MPNEIAPAWMYPAGIVAITLGSLGAIFHTLKGEPLITYALDPLIVIGIPLGWYWLKRSKAASPNERKPSGQAIGAPLLVPAKPPVVVKPLLAPPAIPRELELKPAQPDSSGLNNGLVVGGIMGLIIGLLLGIGIANSSSPTASTPQQLPSKPERPPLPPRQSQSQYWSIGDTKVEVQRIEGAPEVGTGNAWHYNLSDRVVFDESGVVTYWRNSTGKLRTTIGTHEARPERQKNKQFRRASTMHEILAALGMPNEASWKASEDTQDWYYRRQEPAAGNNVVWFRSGLVINWSDELAASGVISQDPDAPVLAAAPVPRLPVAYAAKPIEGPPAARVPHWNDYTETAQGTVTVAADKDGQHLCEIQFSRSVSGFERTELVVFRRNTDAKSFPRYVGKAMVVAARGQVAVAACNDFTAEKGDLALVSLGK